MLNGGVCPKVRRKKKFTLLHECAEARAFYCPGLALHMASILEAGGHVVLQVHISRDASLLPHSHSVGF